MSWTRFVKPLKIVSGRWVNMLNPRKRFLRLVSKLKIVSSRELNFLPDR